MALHSFSKTLTSLGTYLLLSGSQCLLAQEQSEPIVAIIHIDVAPTYAQSGANLLAQLRRDSLRDAGERDFQVLQEIGRPNHFTLVEGWVDRKAYDAHNAAEHTRHFRDELQPMLGSPFDERLHTLMPAGGK